MADDANVRSRSEAKILCIHCKQYVVNCVKCAKCEGCFHPACMVQSAQTKNPVCRHEAISNTNQSEIQDIKQHLFGTVSRQEYLLSMCACMMSDEKLELDDEERGTDVVIVKLDINVGDKFRSFKEFQAKLDGTARANFVRFSKRDSRTIEAARRKVKRHLRPELEFYQLRYACFFSLKNRPRGTGKRKRKSLTREVEVSCPASICVRATDDGEFLEVYNIVALHNHPVSETDYQRLLPKKRSTLEALFDGADANVIEEEFDEEDKYKTVLKKCRHIARIASVSNTSRIHEIIKNLDDYIYYLKYTTPKEEMERIKEENVESNNNRKENIGDNIADENIQIIVEADNAVDI